MSAHALNDPAKVIGIPDDLESILHVFVYIATRFLPQNADDETVLRLLYYYFDDYSDAASGFKCGATKFIAMMWGQIPLNLLSTRHPRSSLGQQKYETLEFYFSPENPSAKSHTYHPIHHLITTLLEWFSDFYSLDLTSTATKDVEDDALIADIPDDLLEELYQVPSDDEVSPAKPTHTAEIRLPSSEEVVKIRAKVEGHSRMRGLFKDALLDREKWPRFDKGTDKKPPAGFVRATQDTFVTSMTLSVKRSADEDEGYVSPSEDAAAFKRARCG